MIKKLLVRGWTVVSVPVVALVIGLVAGVIVIVLTEPELWTSGLLGIPTSIGLGLARAGNAFTALVGGAFGGSSAFAGTVYQTSPLILLGLAATVSFRSGFFNVGGQGQILIGALFGVVVGLHTGALPAIVAMVLVFIASIVGGALWGVIPGVLRARTGASEIITTLMLNFVAVYLVSYLLTLPFLTRDGGNQPISRALPASLLLPSTYVGLALALVAAALCWLLLFRLTSGFAMRMVGENHYAALYSGVSVTGVYLGSTLVAGSLAGLASAIMLLGNQGTLVSTFAGSFGFDAITVAMLGRLDPRGVVVGAVLLGSMRAGAFNMQIQTGVSPDLITMIQAVIIVIIAGPKIVHAILRRRRVGAVERQEVAS